MQKPLLFTHQSQNVYVVGCNRNENDIDAICWYFYHFDSLSFDARAE